MVKCKHWRSNSLCKRIGFIRNRKASRRYTSSSFTRKTLRRSREKITIRPVVRSHIPPKIGRRIQRSTENYVPIVVPGLSTSSSSSATPTSPASLLQDSSSTQGRSREFFSWVSFREWYRESTVFILTSRRTETATFDTSSRNVWWLDNGRSQSAQWSMWISKQSSIRCSGTRFGNTVDTIIPMKNKNVSGNTEERAKVLGADKETKSNSHRQFLEFGKACEDLSCIYSTSTLIGN